MFSGIVQLGAKNVLVVDDENDIVLVIEHMLAQLGMTVDSFTDPRKALEHFRANPAKYDLIVSDFRMPQMSGLEFIRGVRQLDLAVKILVMSAFDPSREEIDSTRQGQLKVSEIIAKPFNFAQFVNAVRRSLGL